MCPYRRQRRNQRQSFRLDPPRTCINMNTMFGAAFVTRTYFVIVQFGTVVATPWLILHKASIPLSMNSQSSVSRFLFSELDPLPLPLPLSPELLELSILMIVVERFGPF